MRCCRRRPRGQGQSPGAPGWTGHHTPFQTLLRLGPGALEFSQPRLFFFFPPHKFKRSHRIFDNLSGAEEVRFYDGIKKQKLEVRFNVLALTFSKVILNLCVCVCVCVEKPRLRRKITAERSKVTPLRRRFKAPREVNYVFVPV